MAAGETSRVCTGCSTEKDLDSFYRARRSPDGRSATCKACHSAKWCRSAGYESPTDRRAREESALRRSRYRKQCRRCGELLPLSKFKRWKNDWVTPYCLGCHEPIGPAISIEEGRRRRREQARRRTPEDRRRERARLAAKAGRTYEPRTLSRDESARRRESVAIGVTLRAWFRLVAQENTDPNAERLRRRDRYRLRYPRIRDQEIARSKAGKRRWRANLKAAGLTAAIWNELKADAVDCGYCGRSLQGKGDAHVDHVVPVSQGGATELSNLVVVCAECNLSKADRTLEVWLRTQAIHVRRLTADTVASL